MLLQIHLKPAPDSDGILRHPQTGRQNQAALFGILFLIIDAAHCTNWACSTGVVLFFLIQKYSLPAATIDE
jgi:hypothetical protein